MGCAGAGLPHLTQAQPCPRLCQPPGLGTRQLSRPPSLIQCQGGQGVFLLTHWCQPLTHFPASTGHLEAALETLPGHLSPGQSCFQAIGSDLSWLEGIALCLPENL